MRRERKLHSTNSPSDIWERRAACKRKTKRAAAKAVEKTLRGKVQEQTFPPRLEIPQRTRDSHFPHSLDCYWVLSACGPTGSGLLRPEWCPFSPALTPCVHQRVTGG